MSRSWLALVAVTLLAVVGTSLSSQGQAQDQAPRRGVPEQTRLPKCCRLSRA